MVFGSVEFLLYFLPIFIILYGITPKALKNLSLLAGSLIFYALGEPRYLALLVVSVVVNYLVGLQFTAHARRNSHKRRNQKILLTVAVIGNVAVLALFKYASGVLGFPLGISFYTFQIISYLVDVYRGDIHRERSLIRFADYICMFPRLTSGPIVNYSEVSGELAERRFTLAGVQNGLKVFIMGLASKVLLADRVGLLWNEVQTAGFESISTQLAWIGAFAFSLKIYFDFYGYSLMAIGLGRMLGFELPDNFETPYMARSVRDFYRRWHITLGRWFRNYVYIPLGGNREGEGRTIFNLLVVWVLTGLWHGGTVNFLIWGLLLWFFIVLERFFTRIPIVKRLKVLPHLYLWIVIPITWMCFEIVDLKELGIYLGRMFGLVEGISVFAGDWSSALKNYGILLAVCFIACTPLVKRIYEKLKNNVLGFICLGSLFWICIWRIIVEGENVFMYGGF